MFQKQLMMRKVMYSLLPIFLFSIYLYGMRAIGIILTTFAIGIGCEYIFVKKQNKKITEAVLVTCALYALSLPPNTPLWITAIGIAFGVSMGKMAYGGFGRNIFNPAITGRLFIYITFPNVVNSWSPPGNFGMVEGVAGATPLEALRSGGGIDLMGHLIGTRTGSLGESSVILILLAGAYLLHTRTASWKSSLSTIAGYAIAQGVLFTLGLSYNPILGMASGSLLFIAVFMVTDPVSSPKKSNSLFVYGILIGVATCIIRAFSLFPEGTSFAILIANTFAPLMDETIGKWQWKGAKV